MPRKLEVKDGLPPNLKINGVIGPLKARKCGNCGHVLFPKSWIDSTNIYVVRGNIKEEKPNNQCRRCESYDSVVYCGQLKFNICSDCCKECNKINECEIRG